MERDRQSEHALSAALVILNEFDRAPGMAQHERLSLAVFSILHAMHSYEEERKQKHVEFSVN
jgi:hypothetical protein